MQYALVEGRRLEAFSGGKGTCAACGNDALAKCGTRRLHHWAHRSLKDCDLSTPSQRAARGPFVGCRMRQKRAFEGSACREIRRERREIPLYGAMKGQHVAGILVASRIASSLRKKYPLCP